MPMPTSSYDPPEAIRVGRMLEDIKASPYEEPCPFDNFDATKKVADTLLIPVALDEQESSQWRFQWCIRNHVADVIQPDLYYYGGLIRSRRVARLAESAGAWPPPCIFPVDLDLCIRSTSPPARLRSGRGIRRVWKPTANGSIRRCTLWMAPSPCPKIRVSALPLRGKF
jgi:hypothetical protein